MSPGVYMCNRAHSGEKDVWRRMLFVFRYIRGKKKSVMLNINHSLSAVICRQPSTVLSCCHLIFTFYQKCNILSCQS